MNHPAWEHAHPLYRRRRLVTIIVTAIVAAAVVGIGVYGLITGPPGERPSPTSPAAVTAPTEETSTPTPTAPSWQNLPPLPTTTDPIKYARAIADALFTWDTMSGLSPAEYANVVLIDADPSGVETPGLLADLDHYLPSDSTWQQLREYQTRQTFTIHDAFVPDSWEQIARDAAGKIRDGTVAITIEGTRHRHGIWHHRAEHSVHDVSFTVFLACQPAFPRCHALRLSEVNNPLT
ncbi:hypothetical protein EF847_10060 [Actinobacteria bacterium YIM 96077]|uniref:Uncharacterized protein n=1 Tax=Phytoactinopolyspora halophila TaxID=1981511 RepID=A0A329QRC1_9ACTN|nr:hypothetical protein [Phytoactinopolyspora halophila]AYY12994.1 hypothetical protein EF847_10060 [Actinobacteria bacterium YIM 96077]RAW13258.1 hypothetical protein DPM12_13085 [Phytoactinopolyspora halophila]